MRGSEGVQSLGNGHEPQNGAPDVVLIRCIQCHRVELFTEVSPIRKVISFDPNFWLLERPKLYSFDCSNGQNFRSLETNFLIQERPLDDIGCTESKQYPVLAFASCGNG